MKLLFSTMLVLFLSLLKLLILAELPVQVLFSLLFFSCQECFFEGGAYVITIYITPKAIFSSQVQDLVVISLSFKGSHRGD